MDRHLTALILRQRGDNRKLASEVAALSEDSKRALYRILNELALEVDRERSKRHRGQYRP